MTGKITFPHLLTLLFLGLKLTGDINWSWWLVLSPMIVLSVVVGIKSGVAEWRKQKETK